MAHWTEPYGKEILICDGCFQSVKFAITKDEKDLCLDCLEKMKED